MRNVLRVVIAAALAAHAVGHAVGFGVAAAPWFAVIWLLPGIGFGIAAWGFWKQQTWWQPLVAGSAIVSLMLEAIAGVALQSGPYASAAAFNVLVLLVLMLPRTRQQLARQ